LTNQELVAPELPQQRDPSSSDLVSGWYKIAQSDQISSKEALQVDNFPTQIVVWRGEDFCIERP
jgi:hypothetical protein